VSQRLRVPLSAFPTCSDRAIVDWQIKAVVRPQPLARPGDMLIVSVVNVPYEITAVSHHTLREASALFDKACGFSSPEAMERGILERYPSLQRQRPPMVYVHKLKRPLDVRWWLPSASPEVVHAGH